MIPYGHQNIDKKDIAQVVKVLESDWITQGPKILEFEKALARYCGAKYAIACSSGTAALHLAYMAAGFKKGDEAITTPNTFAATSNMLVAVGASPVFCDIRLDTYNIDEAKIEKLISKRTKAIVPVHFAGQACEMEKIRKIARKYKLLVIEDACHALGAKYKNSKIGNCRYSDMAIFSFHPVKSITTGEGGAILTNNEKYYKKLILLRNHGIYKDNSGKNVMVELGYNYRLTDIGAALGLSQLEKIDKFIEARRRIVTHYRKLLEGLAGIILPVESEDIYSGWHIFIIRTAKTQMRNDLVAFLKEKGVGVNFHYPCVYNHPYYKQIGYKNIKCPNAEIYESTTLTLPIFPTLTKKDIEYIVLTIRSYFSR